MYCGMPISYIAPILTSVIIFERIILAISGNASALSSQRQLTYFSFGPLSTHFASTIIPRFFSISLDAWLTNKPFPTNVLYALRNSSSVKWSPLPFVPTETALATKYNIPSRFSKSQSRTSLVLILFELSKMVCKIEPLQVL